jgi:hypothetical protein
MTIPAQDRRRRWAYSYDLLIGILGVLILVQLFERQKAPVDLPTLLLFALMAVIVSYFKVPTGTRDTDVSLDGAMLLGAVLVGGPVLGGWAAFITGLASPLTGVNEILPQAFPETGERPTKRRSWRARWVANASAAALHGGRNVMALSTAWVAYQGLGGTLAPTVVDTPLALALITLCVVYALVRCLLQWPAVVLQSAAPEQMLASVAHPTTILIEVIPLPISLLIAAIFVQLGWSFFLLLALVCIGLSTVMRQMMVSIVTMRKQIDLLTLAEQVRRAIANTPHEIDALVALAHRLCTEIVTAPRYEIGLYAPEHRLSAATEEETAGGTALQNTLSHVHIHLAVHDGETLPPMHVPITACWRWLSSRRDPLLAQDRDQLAQLSFSLPPFKEGESPQSAMFVPLVAARAGQNANSDPHEPPREDPPEQGAPIGAIVLQSPHPHAFSSSDTEQIALIADLIGAALTKAHAPLAEDARALPQAELEPVERGNGERKT